MSDLLILSFEVVSGSSADHANPRAAEGLFYGKWVVAMLPILIGVVFHVLTVYIQVLMTRQCLKQRRYVRMSSWPFLGPLLICLGLWWSPSEIPAWGYAIPFVLEILAAVVFVAVRRTTRAVPVRTEELQR